MNYYSALIREEWRGKGRGEKRVRVLLKALES